MAADDRVSVVIATRNRPDELARTLDRLSSLRPVPPILVVDNASTTDVAWLPRHPARPRVIQLRRNRASAARTVGARAATTPYVAFSDDDSWWAPDALSLAADALDRHPRLALVAGQALVEPGGRPDAVTRAMSASPLPATPDGRGSGDDLPGRAVLGCLACACVVRRTAFLAAGGFSELLFIGGEETLLCCDLAAAGWAVRYLDGVVAHHQPAVERPVPWRRALERRNTALLAWLRRPLRLAVARSGQLARDSLTDPTARAALAGLLRRLPTALATRQRLPATVERDLRLLEATGR